MADVEEHRLRGKGGLRVEHKQGVNEGRRENENTSREGARVIGKISK